jgi:N-acetyl-S-(2-succino)cysteine monooxygenase
MCKRVHLRANQDRRQTDGTAVEGRNLDELILPAVGLWMLSEQMRFRLYDYDLDARLPSDEIRASGHASTPRVVSLMDRADCEGLTVRGCANLVAKSRSHGTYVGTVEGLVDHMQIWLDAGGCDGFNNMPAWFPDELGVFVDQVVPVLQRRDLFRKEYAGSMLRDHLGLPYPQHSVNRPASVALTEPGAPE